MTLKDLIALHRHYPKTMTLVFKVDDAVYDELEMTFSYDGKWKATITPINPSTPKKK